MLDNTLAVKTIRNSILNIASFLIGLLVNFYLLRYVVDQIGVESYGISALLFVIIAPLNLTNLGFGEATTKYVAEYVHLGQTAKAGSYVRTTFFMNLIIGLAGCLAIWLAGGPLVMWAFSAQIDVTRTQLVTDCMHIIALGWLFNQCSATFMSVPVALQQFKKVATGNLVFVLTTALATWLLLQNRMGLLGFTMATVTGQLSMLIYWYITARQLLPSVSLAPRIDREAWKQSFHYGGWQTVSQIGGILAQQAEKYVMGVFLAVSSVGIYNVVLNIEQKIYAIVHKLAEVLFPMFSSLSNDTHERKANILVKSSWIVTSVAVCMLIPVIPFSHSLIRLWMKNADLADQGTIILQTLCLGGAFGSATTAGYFFLLGIGRTLKITYISLLTGIVTVGTALLVLPKYGLIAAGWSSLAAAVVQSAAITRVMHTALKSSVSLSSIVTALYAPILTGTAIAFLTYSFFSISCTNWFSLGAAYLSLSAATGLAILVITRLLPDGRQHVALLGKLFSHTFTKLTLRIKT